MLARRISKCHASLFVAARARLRLLSSSVGQGFLHFPCWNPGPKSGSFIANHQEIATGKSSIGKSVLFAFTGWAQGTSKRDDDAMTNEQSVAESRASERKATESFGSQ